MMKFVPETMALPAKCARMPIPFNLDPADVARLEQEKTQLSRQIEVTDASIDKLVSELYGLTEEEIVNVEGSGKT